MNRRRILGNRTLHMVVLLALVAVVLFEPLRGAVPMWEYVVAVGFLVVWLLGQRYERLIVVEAGLADLDEIREAERQSQSWIPWE